jgi:hypothetical protein
MEVTCMQSDYPASALARLAEIMKGCDARWVVGGSTGLVLRGAALKQAPRDLDIYSDRENIPQIHKRLLEYRLDGPENNETERYCSILSHYRLLDTIIELVGDFRVSALQSLYTTEVSEVLYPGSDKVDIQGLDIPIVPLGHELIFNLLRERKDRAIVAGQLISQEPAKHLPMLFTLLQRNSLAAGVAAEALQLAQVDCSLGQAFIQQEEAE